MNAAREDSCLDGRAITAGPRQARAFDGSRQHLEEPASRFVAANEGHQPHRPSDAGHVVRGIAGAAGHDFGRVVFEDQDRRLARDPGNAAIDEFVGNQIAEDDDALAAAGRDQRAQSGCASRLCAIPCLLWRQPL